MRLYSIHPKYLDQKGLCGLWAEANLAQSVLLKGEFEPHPQTPHTRLRKTPYYNHPALKRFKECERPLDAIGQYLLEIYAEAEVRGYNFDSSKIKGKLSPIKLTVTKGQLDYEFEHLQNKLKIRDNLKYKINEGNVVHAISNNKYWIDNIESHPLFKIVEGRVESWEKIK